ncbi:MAG TPA: PP2C family serine/threonine-protein phosphatase [Gemmataceae bacterium]|jgi:hypothetical protein
MWKLLCQSVPGVSHETAGLPCQDHSLGEWTQVDGETVLLLACADGAGSAEHAEVGAQIACEAIVREMREAQGGGLRISDIDGELMMAWHRRVREQLNAEADRRSSRLRDFACTLLAAVVGEQSAVFSQIGDGAIIRQEGDAYRTVFWPQSGEYLNMTNFLTDEGFESRVEFHFHSERVDELALLTDGLQMLALRFADKSVHGPFFLPMFQVLRAAEPPSSLETPLRDFLTSPQVNRRTDDDKTLILATRRLPDDAVHLVRQPEPPD